MTARRELLARLHRLRDVREILSSLKNLAYLETRKLTSRLESQREAVRLIEFAAADFLVHFPEHRAEVNMPLEQTSIIVGSHRGFCGAFNEQVLQSIVPDDSRMIVIGQKLAGKLESDKRVLAVLDGAVVAEEVESIIGELTQRIRSFGTTTLMLLFSNEAGDVQRLPLLPPFRNLSPPVPCPPFPPMLNLAPSDFYAELVEHYLFAVLHLALFASLLEENHQRVRHLEGAVHRLDEKLKDLERRGRQLQQEEITREIEVILLNVMRP